MANGSGVRVEKSVSLIGNAWAPERRIHAGKSACITQYTYIIDERISQAMKKKIDTVLLDFDGTIMDTNEIIIKSWQHTFKALRGHDEDEAVLLKTFGEPLELTMKNFFGGTDEEIMKNIEIYRSYQTDNFVDDIKMFPGTREMITDLKKHGCRVALVTSRLKNTTSQGLVKFGIAEVMDAVVTADDTQKHKPDPEPINVALRKLGSSPEQAVMVGDTWFDMLCAKNAGVKSILVGWSLALRPEDAVGERKPDRILHRAEGMIPLIDGLNA